MGCVPSRELHENPASLQFTRSGALRLAHVPLTPHFFPSPDCLAFRQLHACRDAQSAKYGFGVAGPSRWRRLVGDDWNGVCDEELEPDPSAMYRVDEDFLLHGECNSGTHKNSTGESRGCSTSGSQQDFSFFREPAELYRVLVTHGAVPAMTDTNAEMRALFEEERAWRNARTVIQQHRQRQRATKKGKDDGMDSKEKKRGEEEAATVRAAEQVPPPRRFLRALPCAVLAVLTPEEVEQQQQPSEPHGAAIPRDGALHLLECGNTLFLVAQLHETCIVPPTPVRVVGCESLLPAVCRGTPWLRGHSADPEEDAYIESLPSCQQPPVLCACHFCEASVCAKAFSRARITGFGHYAMHSRMAGMDEPITRPVWHIGLASNVSLLRISAELRQLVRATAFPTGATASVRGNRFLFRMHEEAVRAVCSLCATAAGGLSPQPPCPHMKEQQQQQQQQQQLGADPNDYEYAGCVGVHPRSGELCVPTRILSTLQQRRLNAAEGNEGKMCDSKPRLLCVVVAPWQTATTTVICEGGAEDEDAAHVTFHDGDLITYDDAHERWVLLAQPSVALEDVLLSWVKKTLAGATFRYGDDGWLRDRHRRIVQDGRFYIWCVVHDGLPYFFGVIPVFAKEQRRRQQLRKRKKSLRLESTEKHQQQQEQQEQEQEQEQEQQRQATATMREREICHTMRRVSVPIAGNSEVARFFCNGCFTWNPYGRRG